MKRTEHYDLPTWEMTDRIMMSDFNDMTGKIDGALAALAAAVPKVAAGTYTGTGEEGGSYTRTITCGFRPKFLCVSPEIGQNTHLRLSVSGGIKSATISNSSNGVSALFTFTWTDSGVSWTTTKSGNPEISLNGDGRLYYYFIVG